MLINESAGVYRDSEKIVIVVSYFYLAAPLLSAIKLLAKKNCQVILFYPKDVNGLVPNNAYYNEMLSAGGVHDIKTISFDWQFEKIMRYSKKLGALIKYVEIIFRHRNYRGEVLRNLYLLKPDVLVFLTDMNYSSRMLIDDAKSNKKFIFQPSFIDLTADKLTSNHRIKRIINYFISGLFSTQPYFSLERPNIPLLAWGFRTLKLLSDKRQVILISNPLLQKIGLESNMGVHNHPSLKIKTSNLVVFVSDLHIVFGNEFLQVYKSNLKGIIHLLVKKIKFNKIILKVHPNVSIQNWSDVVEGVEDYVEISGAIDSISLVKKADFVICSDSYVALEALAYGVPVINFIPSQFVNKRNKCLDIDPNWYALDAVCADDILLFFEELSSSSCRTELMKKVQGTRQLLVGKNSLNSACISRIFARSHEH